MLLSMLRRGGPGLMTYQVPTYISCLHRRGRRHLRLDLALHIRWVLEYVQGWEIFAVHPQGCARGG